MKIKARPFFVYYWRGRRPNGHPTCFGHDRFGFLHAHPGGASVLRGESSWRTVNGFYGNVFGGYFIVEFRRFQP